MAETRRHYSTLLVMLGLILLGACSETGDSRSSTTPSISPSPVPSVQTSQSVWQPPEPSTYVDHNTNAEAMPSPTSPAHFPDVIVVYEAFGYNHDLMTITIDGVARVFSYEDITYTLQLPLDRLNALQVKLDEHQFFDMQDVYQDVYAEPEPSAIATVDRARTNAPLFKITFIKDGRSKSVSSNLYASPEALSDIIATLSDLHSEVSTNGVKQSFRPDLLVNYYLKGSKRVWLMDIDVEGGISFVTSTPIARLTPEELNELKALFERANVFDLQDWYSAPHGQRNPMTDHRAIVSYFRGSDYKRIDILTGATIPDDLELVLQKLAEIYDKYAPLNPKE